MKWSDLFQARRVRSQTTAAPHTDVFDFPIARVGTIAVLSGVSQRAKDASGAALVRIDYFDAGGHRIPGPYPGMKGTRRDGQHLRIGSASGDRPFTFHLVPPTTAVRMAVKFRDLQSSGIVFRDVALKWVDPSLNATAEGHPALLKAVQWRMHAQGQLSYSTKLAQRVYKATGSVPDKRLMDRLVGLMRDLDPNWAPTIPRQLRTARPKRDNLVCHLFKVTYPHESSGGAIRGLNLVRSLVDVGYESMVLTPLFYPRTGMAERLTVAGGVTYYNLDLPGGTKVKSPIDALLQYDAVLTASIIAREAPGIIHAASGYRGYELALKALPIGKRLDIPVIYEVRSFHEHQWGDQGTIHSEWTRLRMAQEERCMREAACVVTISQAMQKELIRRGVPEQKIHVVPNAVADDFLTPAPTSGPTRRRSLGIGDETAVIGYVSSLSRREGHEVLIQAVARLHAAGRDVCCLIVGDGLPRGDLEKLAQKLGIADRTVFTGEVDHQSVRSYYEAIDIFVVPRRADYAADYVTPLKPFEALALGRPLIMSDRPVAAEIVGNEERGLLFKTGDHDHLAATIGRLLDDPDLRRTLVEAGRKWVENERTWRRNAEMYREIYQQVAEPLGSMRNWADHNDAKDRPARAQTAKPESKRMV